VRLLLDQNLSRKLVGRLGELYPDSAHVTEVGLETATDREIWNYAAANDYVIVSKDDDFRQLAFMHGAPPKTIRLRSGNVSAAAVLQILVGDREAIERFGSAGDEARLAIPTLTLVQPPPEPID